MDGKLLLLVDPGADYALVKKEALKSRIELNENNNRIYSETFGGTIKAEGVVTMKHSHLETVELKVNVVEKGSIYSCTAY